MAREIIMVMGAQRSGTKALFHSLANDQRLTSFNESVDDAIYDRYYLRPLPTITGLLNAVPGTVLLKPICETLVRSLEEIFEEYKAFDLRVVWIYRDPVNVLYSMYRKGWLRGAKIDDTGLLLQWERRNRLALQFHAQNATKIAIVRYEDCCGDPHVFRDLSEWLGVTGASLFRSDSGAGRKRVARAAQQKISTAVAVTVLALDDARTFKSRMLIRWKRSLVATLFQIRRKGGRARAGLSKEGDSSIRNAAILSAAVCVPSEIEGLQFWLDVSANRPGDDGKIANFRESGPHRMMAGSDAHRPYHKYVNGKAALFFPAEKAGVRRQTGSGIVRFGASHDWSFMFDGSPVSIFAVFKPKVPRSSPNDRQRGVVFRVGSREKAAPSFSLEWNKCWGGSKGICDSGEARVEILATTPVGDLPHQQWRISRLQYGGASETGSPLLNEGLTAPTPSAAWPTRADCDLQLGGNNRERDSLFYGAVAELIIFRCALQPNEQLGVARYLQEKHQI